MPTPVSTQRRTIGEMSADARILYDFITKHFVKGDSQFISYADLVAAIGGRDVQAEARGLLNTARRNVERDFNLLIETVSGEGIKKSDSVAGAVDQAIKHVGRTSRRTARRVVNAMVNREIDNAERVQVGVGLSLLGAMDQFSKPKSRKLLETRVKENEAKELPTAETLRLFAG